MPGALHIDDGLGLGVAHAAPSAPLERVFTLDFLAKGEHVILVGAQGLGKTMLAKNLVHQAVLAGPSARFLTAADLVRDLNGQDTSRALERRLRACDRASSR